MVLLLALVVGFSSLGPCGIARAGDIDVKPTPTFVGSQSCAGCHAGEHMAWRTSQHARAMQHAGADSVLGNFANSTFRHGKVVSTFYRRGDRFFVRTDGADGKLAEFEIRYTFGVAPLQQYLIEQRDGRVQALSIAWDTRPAAAGGQRWFHLYADQKVDHRDELHWTRRSQNWNFMCADCHSTDVRKNHDAGRNTFRSAWSEISVGCEACHGPGSNHVTWARGQGSDPAKGLTIDLSERARAQWTIDAVTGNATREPARARDTEIDTCAQCHSRRSQIGEGFHAGLPFQDFYRPEVLSPGLYHADGQQRDEVYTWGSFRQSRMYHAGVTCSDCHEPHGQKLRAQGNAVCATCHLPAKYDTQDHHHHPGSGAGTKCVECHMPVTTYMVIDPRHDHSLRVPRPDRTISLGTPNACNACHRENDAKWAAGFLDRWHGHKPEGFQRFAEALGAAARGAPDAGPGLVAVARDQAYPAIARASALEALARFRSRAALDVASAGLADTDPQVRRVSVGVLATLPALQRLKLLWPLLEDPVRTVRIEAAQALADAIASGSVLQRRAFDRAAAEFEAAQRFNADRPEARTALGGFYASQGRVDDAHEQWRAALALDRGFVPAYVNQADLFRAQGRESDAERTLREGLRQAPTNAALHHALGLAMVRRGAGASGLAELQRAATLAPSDLRFAYVHAVALNAAGKVKAALAEIERALKLAPDDRDLLVAAITFRRDAGDLPGARPYAERLIRRDPGDAGAAQLARSVGASP